MSLWRFDITLTFRAPILSAAQGGRCFGIDSAVPDRALKMPPCNPKDPVAIPSSAMPYLKLPPATKSVSVELTYRDGSVSEIKTFRR